MSIFSGKHILLGVTGGIAAYKTAYLVRQFIKIGAQVKVVMTESAKNFITPLTLLPYQKMQLFHLLLVKKKMRIHGIIM